MSVLTVEHVARIEGHGNITVDVDGGVVRDVRLEVVEPARFFESMVVGRRFDEVPTIASRICGICSPNHTLTAIKAMEAVLGVEVSERTRVLRDLLVYGSFLQNHATHLYIFAAPDHVGLPSVFPLAETHPDVVDRALRLKKLGNELTAAIGGRSVHPVTAVIGGFTSEPDPRQLEGLREMLIDAERDALETVRLFTAFDDPLFETAGEMLALVDSETYAITDGLVGALDGEWRRPVGEYREFMAETVVAGGNAKHSTVDGRPFMVGALPRLNLSGEQLKPTARGAVAEAGLQLASRNPFLNNLAQAIELVDACERCAGHVSRLLDLGGSSAPTSVRVRSGSGAAATEAPRGTLYHSFSLDDDGIVTAGDIITPTAQNLANLEADMRAFAPTVVDRPREEFMLLVERLVRAYDPCLSCSVH